MSQDTTAPGAPGGPVADDVAVARTEPVAVVQPGLLARLGAEVFGTFVLVLAIVGVALYLRFTNAGIVLPVAFAGGVALAGVIAGVGHVSGGHFNPAVTLGAAIGGRTAWRDVLPYWLAQFVGGALAALVLLATTPQGQAQLDWLAQNQLISEATRAAVFSSTANGFGEHSPISGLTAGNLEFSFASALLLEVIATAVFVGVILGVTDKRASTRGVAPFAIGLTYTALLLVAAPVTNGSLNPARSLASAILAQRGRSSSSGSCSCGARCSAPPSPASSTVRSPSPRRTTTSSARTRSSSARTSPPSRSRARPTPRSWRSPRWSRRPRRSTRRLPSAPPRPTTRTAAPGLPAPESPARPEGAGPS
ncbi:MIP/aquaporin family protein [Cellulosimicrobium sp. CUA-896]|uniref:MIP/aquaporin family protein n=1 Tax=Cellulosimicrobium sp. CUA-896 TaxID=1517881 RepID=UPI000960D39B|nr:aquaporin [Cellulosimicrobium sp. CUA-896]OLT52454.1 hypothetical protein BJF88_13460 [Cellulosimicrobium sp. CUA-896]